MTSLPTVSTKSAMEEVSKKAEKHSEPAEKSDPAAKSRFQEILDYVETTDLEFVQIEKNGTRMSFRRTGVCAKPSPSAAESESGEPEAPKTSSIRSPIVGRFHSSMGPDRPPLVVEGGKVTAGQRVAIVEAMKIKKEVFSAVTGKVVRIPVRDGDPVEYGQELFVVEPDPEDAEGAA